MLANMQEKVKYSLNNLVEKNQRIEALQESPPTIRRGSFDNTVG